MAPLTPERRKELLKHFSEEELVQYEFPEHPAPIDHNTRFREGLANLVQAMNSPPVPAKKATPRKDTFGLGYFELRGKIRVSGLELALDRDVLLVEGGKPAGSLASAELEQYEKAILTRITLVLGELEGRNAEYLVRSMLTVKGKSRCIPCKRTGTVDLVVAKHEYSLLMAALKPVERVVYQILSKKQAILGAGYVLRGNKNHLVYEVKKLLM